MRYYIDITMLPKIDISAGFLWGKVFSEIHLGLHDILKSKGEQPIGIALPDKSRDCPFTGKSPLGLNMRLLAYEKYDLDKLNASMRLARFRDYVSVSGIREIPHRKIQGFAHYERIRPKCDMAYYRRKARRMGLNIDEVIEKFHNVENEYIDAPYINVISKSNDQKFKLFIKERHAEDLVMKGFNCYGLSSISTVPLF
ncbi:MAG: type I-F CRISPR-associated endoribonuclease Cas6/Csy4 [Desulfomonilia bacterium]|jgi:CRISPR-associated endonuclease Csy4|nr:type I-F CRISPR-associated endoribonuclease Cas6/Csy4 [Pseudomonadota bacterium]